MPVEKQTTILKAPLQGLVSRLVDIAYELTGTFLSADAPLMSAGLDSMSATELSTRISERLDLELPPTLLFDHPSLRSIANSTLEDQVGVSILSEMRSIAEEDDKVESTCRRARPQPKATLLHEDNVVGAISGTLLEI